MPFRVAEVEVMLVAELVVALWVVLVELELEKELELDDKLGVVNDIKSPETAFPFEKSASSYAA